jgi:hypothetical protein
MRGKLVQKPARCIGAIFDGGGGAGEGTGVSREDSLRKVGHIPRINHFRSRDRSLTLAARCDRPDTESLSVRCDRFGTEPRALATGPP